MAGNNPVFSRFEKKVKSDGYAGFGRGGTATSPLPGQQAPLSPQDLDTIYRGASAGPRETGRLTLDDVVMKTLGLFAVVMVSATTSWFVTQGSPDLTMPVWIGGMLLGLGVGLAIAFMKSVSVPLIVLYSVFEGAFLGAFSRVIEQTPQYAGIVPTAIVATLATFAGMFVGYKVGLIKVTSKSRRIFGMAAMGYLLFSLVNVIGLFAGWTDGWGFGGSGMLGIGISILGVGLASYSLAIDFDSIDTAVRMQVPEKYSWLLAHGLIVSLVWLYIEIVRLLARLRD
ncbi:Bax inhibitor-1/YccA family protein [Dermatophilaceae bacterium Soc4.6]